MTVTKEIVRPQAAIIQEQRLPWEQLCTMMTDQREKGDRAQEKMGEIAVIAKRQYGKGAIRALAINCFVRKKALYEYMHVVESFDKAFRDEFKRLSFSHLRICSHQDDPKYWVKECDDNNWTVEQLLAEIMESKRARDVGCDETKPGGEVARWICPKCGEEID